MVARATALVVASLALGWSLLLRSDLILSNRGFPVTNEEAAVRRIVHDPSLRSLFRDYSIKSFAGFHIVDWAEWHQDGRYFLVPRWAVISLTSAMLLIVVRFPRRRPRDKQPLEWTAAQDE